MTARPTPEADVQQLGRKLLSLMEDESPSIFKRGFWNGQIMEWSMKLPAFKVEMFRFVDVLPVLHDSREVAQHIQEYFCRPDQDFPAALQWGLKTLSPSSPLARLAASQIEKNVVGMARTFIAGTDARDALPTLKKMWKGDMAFTVDLLGEVALSEPEADDYQRRYLELIEHLAAEAKGWAAKPALERDDRGPLPRVNVSIKLSSLYSQIDAIDPQGSIHALAGRLRPLLRRAKELGVFVNLDAEHYAIKGLTLATFRALLSEPELRDLHAGCVIQAYLRDAEDDLKALIPWARTRGTPVTVRLVKGAYWDFETLHAEQNGWPVPVYTEKAATDACYERLTRLILENLDAVRPAIASHNVRSIAYALATARQLGVPESALEFQTLYGMAEPLKVAIRKMGLRLRDYVPVGELIPGMAYLVRRLLENTSNESWLRARFADGASVEALLASPQPPGHDRTPTGYPAAGIPRCPADLDQPFVNEALWDFADPARRDAMRAALAAARARLGERCPLVINGEDVWAAPGLPSVNPANPAEVVGLAATSTLAHVEQAVQAAARAFPAWRDTPVRQRAALLVKAAALMRAERADLAALMVLEAGKPWREADADVCEAIDFLEYYAREALKLGSSTLTARVPGESNHYSYQPRGIAAIIAPWNFPLAILCGMTAAALVTGSCAIMKPAEQTPTIALRLMRLFQRAGLPPGVAQYLPGKGEEVGAALVDHPKVGVIAFTGSLEVGLQILQRAAVLHPGQRSLKRVIVELGGKNAIIVDSDADLDQAVAGVVRSAFGFQGQKCSACSRVIVLQHNYDAFVSRLLEATRSLRLTPAEDPGCAVGPVIDAEAQRRLLATIERAVASGLQAPLRRAAPPGPGFWVPPAIFTDVPLEHPLAQEELFGPVLAVHKVATLDEALDAALNTRYALTGGLYSRSPLNIERVRRDLRVGNLYINRTITGALVQRQPFGGFGLSGVGSKAGGPDYLLQFVEPRVVTENTIRRGFAPE
jgi:RHH-type proline utilization regulon transcriptional repressor/proline dehydrogenase/delta 1-pyrroline-5-carboxylate dehydrogenase